MTLVVVGLDAADYRLAKRWRCRNLLLNRHVSLETESWSLDVPATIEVWPTIATGLSPDEHGVVLNPTERSSRSLTLKAATWAIQWLPDALRSPIIRFKKAAIGSATPTTELGHVFERGVVTNWPGVTPCDNWARQREFFSAVHSGELSDRDFNREYLTLLGSEISWCAGAAAAGYPIAGIHIHYLDHMGHSYAKRPDRLRDAYDRVDSFIGWLRGCVDGLLIVSDHGMQTTETDDRDPEVHSWHAMAATKLDTDPPVDVRSVRKWIEKRINSEQEDSRSGRVDAPEDHLSDLGYL